MRATRWLGAALLLVMLAGLVAWRHADSAPLARTVAVGTLTGVAVDAQTGRAFVDNDDASGVTILASPGGRVLRTVATGADPDGLAVDVRRARVFVADHDQNALGSSGASVMSGSAAHSGYVAVLDARSGRVLSTIPVGADPDAVAVDQQSSAVFVITEDTSVSILDVPHRTVVSTTVLSQDLRALAVDAHTHRVFVVNDLEGTVSVLDARSGANLRTVAVGPRPNAIAVDERKGRVYVVNNGDNSLSMLDAHSGTPLQTVAVGQNPDAVAVDERKGRVYVASEGATDAAGNPVGPGSVAVLDARSGQITRTLAVGVAPSAVAVDERTGDAFVVNAGGPLSRASAWAWVPRWLRRWLPFLPARDAQTRTVPGSLSVVPARA
jgi:YVTN family beta-propeller protein